MNRADVITYFVMFVFISVSYVTKSISKTDCLLCIICMTLIYIYYLCCVELKAILKNVNDYEQRI